MDERLIRELLERIRRLEQQVAGMPNRLAGQALRYRQIIMGTLEGQLAPGQTVHLFKRHGDYSAFDPPVTVPVHLPAVPEASILESGTFVFAGQIDDEQGDYYVIGQVCLDV